jgi:chemotaxis protein methyltransferase CheR
MQATNSMKAEAEACRYIIDLIYQRCGICLHEGKEVLIKARLGKRLRQLGFDSLPEYCDFLQAGDKEAELERVTDALTTNFTGFLREEVHFKFMVDEALPALLPRSPARFRIWSAASSSGEEPYSIAFYLSDRHPPGRGWDWRITASDISTKVLGKARQGVYAQEQVQRLPQVWLHKFFQKGVGPWEGHYRIKGSLADRVEFLQINLIESYHHAEPFQIIFCRNVLIYFDRPTQERLVNSLCRFLVPGGYLLIGHSESLNGLKVPLRCLRPSIYQKSRP